MTTWVIGPGRVGRCLAWGHRQQGEAVVLFGRQAGPWQTWAAEQNLTTALLEQRKQDLAERPPQRLLFCPGDDVLAESIQDWASAMAGVLPGFAVHTSGIHGLTLLQPLADLGWRTAVLHPLLPFTEAETSWQALSSAVVTVEATEQAKSEVEVLGRLWGCLLHWLPADFDRRPYHLALSLAANHLTALLAWSEELLQPLLGDQARPALTSLAGHAVQAFEERGPAQSLTGPVVRGDAEVVAAHLAALPPEQAGRYRQLLEPLLDLAERSGRLSREGSQALRLLLNPSALDEESPDSKA